MAKYSTIGGVSIGEGSRFGVRTHIARGVIIGQNVTIGNDVIIDECVTLEDDVVVFPGTRIFPWVRIGKGARVGVPPASSEGMHYIETVVNEGAVIEPGAEILAGERVKGRLARMRDER